MACTTSATEGTPDDITTIMRALGLEASVNHPQGQNSFSVDTVPRGDFINPPLLLAVSVGKTFKFEIKDKKLWPVALGCAALDMAMISERAPGKDGSAWAATVKGEVYTIAGRQDSLYADLISAGCEPSEKNELSIRDFGKWLHSGIIDNDQKPRHTVIICDNIAELESLEDELECRFCEMPGIVKVIGITDLYKVVWPSKPVQTIFEMINAVDTSGQAALEVKSKAIVTLELVLLMAVTVAQRRLPAPERKSAGIMGSVLRSIGGAPSGRVHASGPQGALPSSLMQASGVALVSTAISDRARTSSAEAQTKTAGASVAQRTTASTAAASPVRTQDTQTQTSTAGDAVRAPAAAAARDINPASALAAPPAAKVSPPSEVQTQPAPQRTAKAADPVPQSRPAGTSTAERAARSAVLPVKDCTTASPVSSAPAPITPTQTVAVSTRKITLLSPKLVYSQRALYPDPRPVGYEIVLFTAEDRKTVIILSAKIRELPKRISQRVTRYSELCRAIELWLINNARNLGFENLGEIIHWYTHEWASGDTERRIGIEHNEGFKILGRFLASKARIPADVSQRIGWAAYLRNFVSDWHDNLQTYNKVLDKWEDLPITHEQVKVTKNHRVFTTMLGELAVILKSE
ncbi:hypothetical protein LTS10_003163 [Elasticomyces elasticus]|nr:hypothetical protein LTS10_003163 [Elasticomyces elasticus]